MRRFITIGCACLGALLLPASVAAADDSKIKNPRSLAAKQCAAEKKADKTAFLALHGKHAMRECLRAAAPDAKDELKNAAKECKAAREADPEGFEDAYGSNRNAFGKCVSQTAKKATENAVEEFKNAAKECRAAREDDPDEFADTYGSNGGNGNGAKRNALGKCVSEKVKEGNGPKL